VKGINRVCVGGRKYGEKGKIHVFRKGDKVGWKSREGCLDDPNVPQIGREKGAREGGLTSADGRRPFVYDPSKIEDRCSGESRN